MVKKGIVLVCAGIHFAGPVLARELSEADFPDELPTVLSASRLAQSLEDAPISITVIDRELIEASACRNLSDLFRLVPGFIVGQELGWFHNVSGTLVESYSRRMQVLVDGRSIYLSSFGGVRRDAIPLSLDDIERIEVVRDANAASFGANSFTGVISIITRHPQDVAGRMLHLIAGEHAHREAWFRWAGAGEASAHRVTPGRREDGGLIKLLDDARSNIFNYRGDFDFSGGSALSVQLGYLHGDSGPGGANRPLDLPHDQAVDGHSLHASNHVPLSPDRALLVKASLDHLQMRETVPAYYPGLFPAGSHYSLDLLSRRWHGAFQINSQRGDGLRSSTGANLRRDEVSSADYYGQADKLGANSRGAFAHGEIRFSPEWLVNIGTFFEDHDLADSRGSSRATLHWQPNAHHSVRFGVSRAYRNPAMFETDACWRLDVLGPDGVPMPLPVKGAFIQSSGNVGPEVMLSQEIGYLGQWPEAGLNLDLRVFQERIDGYISAECTQDRKHATRLFRSPSVISTASALRIGRAWKPHSIGNPPPGPV